MKKVLFYLGHPAHYHNMSQVARILSEKGHEIILVARQKDVLLDLIKETPYRKIIFPKRKENNTKLNLFFSVFMREIRLLLICLKHKPQMMIGTDIVITNIGKLLGIPAFILNEDDAKEVPFLAKYGFKYSTKTFSPQCCDISPYQNKKISYQGYHELAYLHPKYFHPDKNKVAHLYKNAERYFIIRFSKLNAHHDAGKSGITDQLAKRIIEKLLPHGTVYISSERELSTDMEKYRINIDPKLMHHVLYYADMLISDSQTMTAEAAVLGTPSIRFNDFVGKLGYLEELEHQYGLTFGIKTNESEVLFSIIEKLLCVKDLKKEWSLKREKMLSSSIDVTSFWAWFFENYPESNLMMEQNKDYASNFK